jgi:hypothetical protein
VSFTAPQLRSSLILIALWAALPCAWADDSPAPAAAPATTDAPVHRSLDLTPPDIRKVMPSEQLEAPLADPDARPDDPETVQVKGATGTPEVPGGIASVFWALWHPTQAWRILAPVR